MDGGDVSDENDCERDADTTRAEVKATDDVADWDVIESDSDVDDSPGEEVEENAVDELSDEDGVASWLSTLGTPAVGLSFDDVNEPEVEAGPDVLLLASERTTLPTGLNDRADDISPSLCPMTSLCGRR